MLSPGIGVYMLEYNLAGPFSSPSSADMFSFAVLVTSALSPLEDISSPVSFLK